ncbi:unnamed protein product [Symbiodinium natans]|uniref:Uncharacterized protein n=1 Tax=Symbiodinium natans TaxID=878477 RepID=A0A812Q4C6_9DINO|nr:unnamed protein product [Symbiodinium natans]
MKKAALLHRAARICRMTSTLASTTRNSTILGFERKYETKCCEHTRWMGWYVFNGYEGGCVGCRSRRMAMQTRRTHRPRRTSLCQADLGALQGGRRWFRTGCAPQRHPQPLRANVEERDAASTEARHHTHSCHPSGHVCGLNLQEGYDAFQPAADAAFREDAEGFRSFYEALQLNPCLDPIHTSGLRAVEDAAQMRSKTSQPTLPMLSAALFALEQGRFRRAIWHCKHHAGRGVRSADEKQNNSSLRRELAARWHATYSEVCLNTTGSFRQPAGPPTTLPAQLPLRVPAYTTHRQ